MTRFVVSFCHPRSSIKNVKDKPRPSCCHPRPRSGIQGLGGVVIWKDAGRHVPYRLMVSVCRGGPGCPPFLSFLLRGFAPARRGEEDCGVSAPHDEVLLFRQKNPKPVAPGRGPPEGVPVPRSLVCGLRNSLRSDSPRRQMEGTGPGHSPARRRQERAFAVTPSVMPGLIGHPAFCHPRPSCCHPRPRSGIQRLW